MSEQEKKPDHKRFHVQVKPGTPVQHIDFPADAKDPTKPAGSVRFSPGTMELIEAEISWLRKNRPDVARTLNVVELPAPATKAPEAKRAPADEAPQAPAAKEATPENAPEDKGTSPQRPPKNR